MRYGFFACLKGFDFLMKVIFPSLLILQAGKGYGSDINVKLKCATIAPHGSVFEEISEKVVNKIESILKIDFAVYYGSAYGDEIDIVRALRDRKLDCAFLTQNGLGFLLSYFRVLDLPFLIKSYDEGRKLAHRLNPIFEKVLLDSGYYFFGSIEVGFVHLFSKYPIEDVKDLKNRTFWVWPTNAIQLESFAVFKKFGMKGVNIDLFLIPEFSDTIDVIWFPKYALVAYGWHKPYKFIVDPPLIYFTGGVVIRTDVLDIPKDLYEKVRKEVMLLMSEASELMREENEKAEIFLLSSGVKKVVLKDVDKLEEAFRDIMWTSFKKYIPEWLIVSALEEISKIRRGAHLKQP